MKVFKVVREVGDTFISATPNHELTYAVGERTVPRVGDGPLAAFTDLRFAVRFMQERVNFPGNEGRVYRVFTARAVRYTQKKMELWYHCYSEFYNNKPVRRSTLPDGTVLCKAITLLDSLERREA